MNIFRLLYHEKLRPAKIGGLLHRHESSSIWEIAKGLDNRMYNPCIAEIKHLEKKKESMPKPEDGCEGMGIDQAQSGLRWSLEQDASWLETSYPEQAMSGNTICLGLFSPEGETEKTGVLQDLWLRGKGVGFPK
jgi:hypothetical protein